MRVGQLPCGMCYVVILLPINRTSSSSVKATENSNTIFWRMLAFVGMLSPLISLQTPYRGEEGAADLRVLVTPQKDL
jgi:hypothetical protein